MRKTVLVLLLVLIGTVLGLGGYYMGGRSDALEDVRPLTRLADKLIARGEGGAGLGPGREAMLLTVVNAGCPANADDAPLMRALALRLGFEHFEPGPARIRLAGYAHALAERLPRRRIIALWLETVEMGRGPDGPITGFYEASKAIYDTPPAKLSDDEFLRLVAASAGPFQYRLNGSDPALDARVARIRELLASRCKQVREGARGHRGCPGA